MVTETRRRNVKSAKLGRWMNEWEEKRSVSKEQLKGYDENESENFMQFGSISLP
jgi:hypothetical protein